MKNRVWLWRWPNLFLFILVNFSSLAWIKKEALTISTSWSQNHSIFQAKHFIHELFFYTVFHIQREENNKNKNNNSWQIFVLKNLIESLTLLRTVRLNQDSYGWKCWWWVLDKKFVTFYCWMCPLLRPEKQKQKMWKTGFYGLFQCKGSTVEQFSFFKVSRKIARFAIFLQPLI